jgi:hypothetical protein
MPKPSTPPQQQPSAESTGFLAQLGRDWKEHRKKGVLRQQKDMAISERQTRFFGEAKRAVDKVRKMRVAPTRVESFEAAVARQGLSEQFLLGQLQRHKWVHLALYLVAGGLFVYAFWMFMNRSAFLAAGVLIASLAIAVNGYLHGFRAWQIENRNLIRLQDALRIPATYLVL